MVVVHEVDPLSMLHRLTGQRFEPAQRRTRPVPMGGACQMTVEQCIALVEEGRA
jgi:hypothetical protein